MTMLIFFDTEFTNLSADAKLISIGLVDEAGERTFYAELSDTWKERDASDFVTTEVIPWLAGNEVRIPKAALCEQLAAWLLSFDEPVQLATDSMSWDWIWIVDLFGAPGGDKWPTNLDPRPFLLTMNYLTRYDEFVAAIEGIFAKGIMRRHHALDDAKVNRLAWLASEKP
ncbi:MAG: 3'-5' exoribonuclease [Rhodocyclaceae bacterium]|nr:3'-5' exoribonuclease [Rhodocyclaceae bacterium]